MLKTFISVLICLGISTVVNAQLSETATWAVQAETRYNYYPDVSYGSENGVELKLDIYARRDVTTPQPTLVFMHGGFWVAGAKDNQLTALLPWLEKGWNVVNVEYRLGAVALAPAAVVDSFCALRFIGENAAMYNFDVNRIVASGQSAGGHLALALGMMGEAGFDNNCPSGTTPKVAAVINWYGVTDVPDVISGPNKSDTARRWFGDMSEADAITLAEKLSPINYVRNGLPPILTIQGDADNVVPFAEGIMLDKLMNTTNGIHEHLTIPGGGHGRFNAEQRVLIYETINKFLKTANLE